MGRKPKPIPPIPAGRSVTCNRFIDAEVAHGAVARRFDPPTPSPLPPLGRAYSGDAFIDRDTFQQAVALRFDPPTPSPTPTPTPTGRAYSGDGFTDRDTFQEARIDMVDRFHPAVIGGEVAAEETAWTLASASQVAQQETPRQWMSASASLVVES